MRRSRKACTTADRQYSTPIRTQPCYTHPVWKQAVPNSDRGSRGVRNRIPPVWLLRERAPHVVVPVEWHERRQLHPPPAELFVRVVLEATRVGANERDLEDLELEHALDTEVHVLPLAIVVAEPVSGPPARAWECRATDQEWALSRVDVQEGEMGRLLLHHTPHIVHVDLCNASSVGRVSGDIVVRERRVP